MLPRITRAFHAAGVVKKKIRGNFCYSPGVWSKHRGKFAFFQMTTISLYQIEKKRSGEKIANLHEYRPICMQRDGSVQIPVAPRPDKCIHFG